ncbi:hypothetical protein BHS07_33620 [Myxococcus xanthus]|nr:hypothetical protein BHS07_33620 [Myxococcus xanthus]
MPVTKASGGVGGVGLPEDVDEDGFGGGGGEPVVRVGVMLDVFVVVLFVMRPMALSPSSW